MTEKQPGTAVVTWKDRMAAVVAKSAAMEAPKGGFLSFRGGRLSYDDTPIPGDKIQVIVLDHVLENTWFKEDFNPAKTASPACYALGREEEALEPHADCEEPKGGEGGGCATCPLNEWGSDRKGGRGKDCKNTRRIAMIPADVLVKFNAGDTDALKKASVVMCKLPVTSTKAFSKFINSIVKAMEVPPFQIITELSVSPHPANQFQVNWKVMDKIADDHPSLPVLYEKHVACEKLLFQPYPKMEEQAPAASKSTKY